MTEHEPSVRRPNIIYIFADEWRAQATGYNGDANCETPVLDELASQSIDVTHTVAGCSVCCPSRASLMTGQYPLTHGVYINDTELNPNCDSIARAFNDGGYDTAYIGKWHIYGSPEGHFERRKSYVPRAYQLGFEYWKGFECNHDYNDSTYFFNDDPTPRKWEGYDAFAQSRDAADYIQNHSENENPFLLMLSWGPPHFPLHTAPPEYRERYAEREIELRANVPPEFREQAVKDLRGYYAHIAALDDCLAILLDAIREAGIEENTILVWTSDHGDMRSSQGLETKLFPWDESIRVPFLLRWPQLHGNEGSRLSIPLDTPDMMPTLLGLCGLPIPDTVEGRDWSPYFRDETQPDGCEAAFLNMPAEFTELLYTGMNAYRGLRTIRYTYVRNFDGPWLLYDNETDPYQMKNLINNPAYSELQATLEIRLQQRLDDLGDEFLDGRIYLERDGLTHYVEVNEGIKRRWRDPWK
ncbi:MAG: sulfatase [Chloroflexota bacterium]|nr:sulfatase [Chloroflexota bacterium]